jgi:hypothetical protein
LNLLSLWKLSFGYFHHTAAALQRKKAMSEKQLFPRRLNFFTENLHLLRRHCVSRSLTEYQDFRASKNQAGLIMAEFIDCGDRFHPKQSTFATSDADFFQISQQPLTIALFLDTEAIVPVQRVY